MAQLEETRKDDLGPREDQDSEEGQERDESLSGDRVTALRQLIDAHLRKNNVYEDIRKFVAGMGAEEGKVDSFDALRERKVIERVIRSLETQPAGQSASRTPSLKHAVKPGAQYLLVKVTGGRGFSETRSEANDDRQFVLCMHYGQQRFVADPVSCAQEPALDASFLVQISDQISFASSSPERQAQAVRELLQESSALQGLHFLIMRTRRSAIDSAKDLVASHVLEWRRLLASASGAATVAVELHATGEAAKVRVPAGILDLRLELVPARPGPSPLTDEKLLTSLRANTKQAGQAYRQFCEYARAWWEEFVELDDRFRHRLVKIFAENEWGDHEPVFAFVRPMRAGRLLASARHAARFVSLIPYTREEMVGGSRLEVWHVAHTFLSKGRGDCEDHAVLLCNLLLGFGLNAFVCMGTVQDSPEEPERDHVWCMTLSGKDNRTCTFWESLTGHRVVMAPRRDVESAAQTALRQSYRRIACAFNHESFYANKQRDDRTEHCSFNVLDDMRWKAMDERLIAAIQKRPVVPLRAPTIPEHERSDEIEIALRELVAAERAQQLDLDTRWDADLGDYLAPALCAYETERLTGVLAGNEDFQAAIRGHVPPGHSFKAFPTLLKTIDPHKILHALRKSTVASELLHTRADHTHFALRVMVLPFPEDVVAVWVMLAVRFRAS
ncbi:Centrosomal protein of 76 kDa [Hondaea fermentalgiana]|uniref:Centrosomal protein of 76 kDa n=1 Tax=Hondaea fermentalgiana TaxID=2315210 RepID=A0A2R5GMW5_9STRA|nr:Centrosomal protein of 76 kDa [Hondaea fermentalgiana]|eukprot:GBG32242.1 Centrosomal protein of 76 kDa [Hondaea fermentalgiana]